MHYNDACKVSSTPWQWWQLYGERRRSGRGGVKRAGTWYAQDPDTQP